MSLSTRRRHGLRLLLVVPLLASIVACGGGGSGGGGGTAGFVSQDLASVSPTPILAAQNTGPGQFAADYLRGTHFDTLTVEVDYPSDRPPTQSSLDLLQARLGERCDKTGGVTVSTSTAIATSEFGTILSANDLAHLEDAHRSTYSDLPSKTVAMYVLYVHGHSNLNTPSGKVVGLSYRGGSFAVFIDDADPAASPPFITKAEVEGTVIVHESGHLLGLVNGGVPMIHPHEDPSSNVHCDNNSCVMYFQIRVPLGLPNIGDPTFAQWDTHCVEDLQAFGGLGPVGSPAMVSTSSPDPYGEPVTIGVCPTCLAAMRAAQADAAATSGACPAGR